MLWTEEPRRIIGLTIREYQRLLVLQKLVRRDLTRKQAAEQLDVSPRQIHILKRRYLEAGAVGLISGHRGKPSNRAIPTAIRKKAIDLVRKRYAHLGPTRVCEHLANRHGISVSTSTLNTWMTAAGLWQPRSERTSKAAVKPIRDGRGTQPQGRYIPLFDDWVLDTHELVATADGPKGLKRLKLIWYDGAICWCEASGRYGGRQLQNVLDATRRYLCPDNFNARHWYVPETMGQVRGAQQHDSGAGVTSDA